MRTECDPRHVEGEPFEHFREIRSNNPDTTYRIHRPGCSKLTCSGHENLPCFWRATDFELVRLAISSSFLNAGIIRNISLGNYRSTARRDSKYVLDSENLS